MLNLTTPFTRRRLVVGLRKRIRSQCVFVRLNMKILLYNSMFVYFIVDIMLRLNVFSTSKLDSV